MTSTDTVQTIQKLRRQHAALARFGRFAFNETDLLTILTEASRICAASLEVPFSMVCRYRPIENDLLVEAGCGWDFGVVGRVVSQAVETSPHGRAYVTGEPIIIRDIRGANNRLALPDFYAQHRIISTVDVLISAPDGQSYGVLEIASPSLHQFDEHDVNFLTGFANVLAEAVASTQKNKAMQELLERQRLLDSELQHRVRNNLQMVTGMLNNYARSASDDMSRQAIGSMSRHVVTLAHVYDSLLGIGLAPIVDFSTYLRALCASLPGLQDGYTDHVRLECYAEPIMLPLDSVTSLGMAVAELVTNGYRHAFPYRDGTIVVTLAHLSDFGDGILMIQDDGMGFDTTAASTRRGLGLVRQLVEQIGGTADVRSEVGTLWTLTVPLTRKAGSLKTAA
jgi:two-component sensor histidine kinase/putative methionine-R-sulfoxide reductase with GAF domain